MTRPLLFSASCRNASRVLHVSDAIGVKLHKYANFIPAEWKT